MSWENGKYTLIKYWILVGQILVKFWSNTDQVPLVNWSNTDPILRKYWSSPKPIVIKYCFNYNMKKKTEYLICSIFWAQILWICKNPNYFFFYLLIKLEGGGGLLLYVNNWENLLPFVKWSLEARYSQSGLLCTYQADHSKFLIVSSPPPWKTRDFGIALLRGNESSQNFDTRGTSPTPPCVP